MHPGIQLDVYLGLFPGSDASQNHAMKLFNETEIGFILKRAAELSHDDSDTASMGLSVEELQQLGTEAGLNPDFILQAAAELQTSRQTPGKKNFIGGPLSYNREIVLDGEIYSTDWEEMITPIRNTFKDPGVVSTRKNTFEWTVKSDVGSAQVTARLVNGQTRISVFWNNPSVAVLFMTPVFLSLVVSLPIVLGALEMTGFPAAAAIIGAVSTVFLLGRFGLGRYIDRFKEKIDQMIASFELISSRGELSRARESRVSLPEEPSTSRIELEGPDAEGESEPTIRNRDRA